jgi:hypothetical protein
MPADMADCTGIGPGLLRVPGARTPDFGPAAINPGARPGCGNPGNPTPCAPSCVGCGPCTTCGGPCTTCGGTADLKKKLTAFLGAEARALRRLGIRGLRRRKRTGVAYEADQAGVLAVRFTGTATAAASRATLIAKGRRAWTAPGRARLVLKLTRRGARVLRRAQRVRGSLKATFTPTGGNATSATKGIRLRR